MVRIEFERNAKRMWRGGLMGTISFSTLWLFLGKQKKIRIWRQHVGTEGQSCGNKECHCPGAIQRKKDLTTFLLPGRWGVHPSPCTPWWQQEPGGHPNMLFLLPRKSHCLGSKPTKQGQSYGQPHPGVSEAGAGSWAAFSSLCKSTIQHTENYTSLKGITTTIVDLFN